VDLPALQELIKTSAGQKRITVIDFWATWCIPCVEIFPGLHEGLIKLGPKVRPVTVTLDGDDTIPAAVKFLEDHHASQDAYMLVPDTDKQLAVVAGLGKKWDNLVVPVVLVFDENGKLAAEFTLTVKTEDVLKQVKGMVEGK
jgi:thiol-disulfide isomerase/thioredoxin